MYEILNPTCQVINFLNNLRCKHRHFTERAKLQKKLEPCLLRLGTGDLIISGAKCNSSRVLCSALKQKHNSIRPKSCQLQDAKSLKVTNDCETEAIFFKLMCYRFEFNWGIKKIYWNCKLKCGKSGFKILRYPQKLFKVPIDFSWENKFGRSNCKLDRTRRGESKKNPNFTCGENGES